MAWARRRHGDRGQACFGLPYARSFCWIFILDFALFYVSFGPCGLVICFFLLDFRLGLYFGPYACCIFVLSDQLRFGLI